MLSFILTAETTPRARFYRVAVEYNLFGEYSVSREWGRRGAGGRRGRERLSWFSNLRDACIAAERWRRRAERRGYRQA
ncbi:MAG: WGR domain-containing protein [Paracoccaceae bacterium]